LHEKNKTRRKGHNTTADLKGGGVAGETKEGKDARTRKKRTQQSRVLENGGGGRGEIKKIQHETIFAGKCARRGKGGSKGRGYETVHRVRSKSILE